MRAFPFWQAIIRGEFPNSTQVIRRAPTVEHMQREVIQTHISHRHRKPTRFTENYKLYEISLCIPAKGLAIFPGFSFKSEQCEGENFL